MSITAGSFTFIETELEGVYMIESKSYGDSRGYFMETYKKTDFDAAGLDYDFVHQPHLGVSAQSQRHRRNTVGMREVRPRQG